MKQRTLELDPWERQTLEEMRDHHPIAYLRERAAALLKIADGMSPYAVARQGLLKPRDPDTVYAWLDGYEQWGLAGLYHQPRRQREVPPDQQTELQEAVHRAPELFGIARTRWTLAALRQAVSGLKGYTLSGVWRILRAFRIHYKRGRQYVHSPDPEYDRKAKAVEKGLEAARRQPQRVVLYFLDEFSFYRQPTVASAWHAAGSTQPLARRSHHANIYHRVIGALNAVTGRLLFRMGTKIGVRRICAFLRAIRREHPDRTITIYVVLDNWHQVHNHPAVQETAAQESIELVYLPTYAPWLNPIEKVWRKAYQEELHLHGLSDPWDELKERMRTFFAQFAHGSPELLRYVGLLPN